MPYYNPYTPYQQYAPMYAPDGRQQVGTQMSLPQQNMPMSQSQMSGSPQPGPSFALVNNEQEARDFLVLPGNSVFLMSRNDPVFWLKTTDQSGLALPLRVFDYTERVSGAQAAVQSAQAPSGEFVTRDVYDALAARVAALESRKCACSKKKEPAETEDIVNG